MKFRNNWKSISPTDHIAITILSIISLFLILTIIILNAN